MQTIFTARDGMPFDGRKPEYLAEGDRHEREVNAASMGDERGDDCPGQGGCQDGKDNPQPDVHHHMLLGQSEGIGTNPKISTMSEGRLARIT